MTTSNGYNEKLNRIKSVINRDLPDRVPVVPPIETWVYNYADIDIKKAMIEDPELAIKAFQRFTNDIYVDALLSTSNTIPFKVMDLFGEGLYTVTKDGFQIKGSYSHDKLNPKEYPEFIENPQKFITDKTIARKYPLLTKNSTEENITLFENAFDLLKEYNAFNAEVQKGLRNRVGLPMLVRGGFYVAPDVILDYLRDFVGTSTDIRRYPEELYAACEGIHELVLTLLLESYNPPKEGYVVFSPLHLPTYLKPKDFERFYFPFLKRSVEELSIERGYTILFYMENFWEPYLDILQDLPDGAKVIGLLEHGDLSLYKERLGKKMVVMGGMPIDLLARGTKQQCLDKAKECLDLYAPGGNYIFSLNMVLLRLQDAAPKNVIATFDYIHENGKY